MGKGGGEQTLRQRLHVAQLLFKGGAQGVDFGELRFQSGGDAALVRDIWKLQFYICNLL